MYKIFVINPGSTSTKIALYQNTDNIFTLNIYHSTTELSQFSDIISQFEYRKQLIIEYLQKEKIQIEEIDCFVGRGGLLNPVPSGTYTVNDIMVQDLRTGVQGQHASNLGGLLARSLGDLFSKPSFIIDPVVVDELEDIARISGHPLFTRKSIFHALNQKAVARKASAKLGKDYRELNLIVCHLGGGISIGAHKKGLVVDVNNALDGEGPFTPERAGTLPAGDLVKLCFSGKYTLNEISKMITGKGGFVAFLNTNNIQTIIEQMAENNSARLLYNSMIYQISRYIGAQSVVLKGQIDAIVLTGGIAYNPLVISDISEYVSFLAPVLVFPGEEEMEALALGALRVLMGEEKARHYAAEAK